MAQDSSTSPISSSTVGARALRADLSMFVDRAARGESIAITRSGRTVALLGPVRGGATSVSSLEDLARLGLIERPAGRSRDRRGEQLDETDPAIPSDVRVDRLIRQVRG